MNDPKPLEEKKMQASWIGEITLRCTRPDIRPKSVIELMSEKEKKATNLRWILFGK